MEYIWAYYFCRLEFVYPLFKKYISFHLNKINLLLNIYNGIIFPPLNHAKIFDSNPDEHSHKVVRQLVKSHAQWLTLNMVKRVRKKEKFEFITSKVSFKLMETL